MHKDAENTGQRKRFIIKTPSVRQPWAWSIDYGLKLIENGTWPTNYRGLLQIHAGKSLDEFEGGRDYSALLPGLAPKGELAFAAIIGTVAVVDCVPLATVLGQPFAEGPWCWLLLIPRPIIPIACKEMLGLFDFVLTPPLSIE
jgi:hypothetical protein